MEQKEYDVEDERIARRMVETGNACYASKVSVKSDLQSDNKAPKAPIEKEKEKMLEKYENKAIMDTPLNKIVKKKSKRKSKKRR